MEAQVTANTYFSNMPVVLALVMGRGGANRFGSEEEEYGATMTLSTKLLSWPTFYALQCAKLKADGVRRKHLPGLQQRLGHSAGYSVGTVSWA